MFLDSKRIKDLAEWFLSHPDKKPKRTLDKDRERFKSHLLPYLGHCKPHDINSSMIDDHKVKRQKHFAANAPINRKLALLKSMFNFDGKTWILSGGSSSSRLAKPVSKGPSLSTLKLLKGSIRYVEEF